MGSSVLIMALAVGTLAAVVVIAFVQLRKHKESQLNRGEAPGGMAGRRRKSCATAEPGQRRNAATISTCDDHRNWSTASAATRR